jgi:hypothetical protein
MFGATCDRDAIGQLGRDIDALFFADSATPRASRSLDDFIQEFTS